MTAQQLRLFTGLCVVTTLLLIGSAVTAAFCYAIP